MRNKNERIHQITKFKTKQMEKEKLPEGSVSKAKWQSSWRDSFMNYDDKQKIASNTLSSSLIGK